MKLSSAVVAVALSASLAVPVRAMAQTCSPSDPNCVGAVTSSASAALVATIALPVTTVGALIYIVIAAVNASHPAPSGRAAALYLKQNQLELAQDLAAGSGPVLSDLAAAMELESEHVDHFAKLMQQNRKQLAPLIEPTNLSPATAVQFIETMTDLVRHDAVLAPDFQAYLAHHQVQG